MDEVIPKPTSLSVLKEVMNEIIKIEWYYNLYKLFLLI